MPGLAAEPKVPDACALCIPISGPLFMPSLWLVASRSLVPRALIPGGFRFSVSGSCAGLSPVSTLMSSSHVD